MNLAAQHRGVVTVEDNALAGGFGSALLELFADHDICLPVKRAGLPDVFVKHGSIELLRTDVGLTAACVAEAARQVLAGPPKRTRRGG